MIFHNGAARLAASKIRKKSSSSTALHSTSTVTTGLLHICALLRTLRTQSMTSVNKHLCAESPFTSVKFATVFCLCIGMHPWCNPHIRCNPVAKFPTQQSVCSTLPEQLLRVTPVSFIWRQICSALSRRVHSPDPSHHICINTLSFL